MFYFIEHQNNAKKTWEFIRNLINVSKKKALPPKKLIHNKQVKTSNIAQTINEFFGNIGESVEAKIPQVNKYIIFVILKAA